jgi:hypothetical protein
MMTAQQMLNIRFPSLLYSPMSISMELKFDLGNIVRQNNLLIRIVV